MAVQDEPAEHVAVRRALAGLEVDEVAGLERAAPPRHELLGPGEPEPAPVAGRAEQAVEPAQGVRAILGRADGALELGRRGVPAHDDDAVALGTPDPLPGRLRDAVHHARPRPCRRAAGAPSGGARAGSRGCRGSRRRRARGGTRRWRPPTSGSAASTSMPPSERWTASAASDSPTRTPSASVAHGVPSTTGPRGTYAEPPPIPCHGRTRTSARASPTTWNRASQPVASRCAAQARDWSTWPPSTSTAARVPVVELVGVQLPDRRHASPPSPPPSPAYPEADDPPLRPCRSRSTRTRAAWATAYVRRPSGSSTRSYAPT